MASIRQFKGKWQVQIRLKGVKSIARSFEGEEDARDWAKREETRLKRERNLLPTNLDTKEEIHKRALNKKRVKRYKQKNYAKVFDYRLRSKYGIDSERFYFLKAKQGEKCFICGIHYKEAPKNTLVVDHCHTSGQVRGLLCNSCNAGLGMFKDSVEVLFKAVKYLEQRQ